MLNVDSRHPIRQRMVWVGLIQLIVTSLTAYGLSAEVITGIGDVLAGVANVLVLLGVLYVGTTNAEENTTPLDDGGDPLNLEYQKVS